MELLSYNYTLAVEDHCNAVDDMGSCIEVALCIYIVKNKVTVCIISPVLCIYACSQWKTCCRIYEASYRYAVLCDNKDRISVDNLTVRCYAGTALCSSQHNVLCAVADKLSFLKSGSVITNCGNCHINAVS